MHPAYGGMQSLFYLLSGITGILPYSIPNTIGSCVFISAISFLFASTDCIYTFVSNCFLMADHSSKL